MNWKKYEEFRLLGLFFVLWILGTVFVFILPSVEILGYAFNPVAIPVFFLFANLAFRFVTTNAQATLSLFILFTLAEFGTTLIYFWILRKLKIIKYKRQ